MGYDYDYEVEKWHYSLCQTVVDEKTNYFKLLRLADFLNVSTTASLQKNVPRKLFAEHWDDAEFKLISRNQQPIYGTVNQLGIWKWKIEPQNKTYSERIGDSRFIEFFPAFSWTKKTDFNSLVATFENLLNGVEIPIDIDIHPPFLLGLDFNDANYICLYIKPDWYNMRQTSLQLIEGKEYTIYSLPKSDFVESAETMDKLEKNDKIQFQNSSFHARIVYLRYPLPDKYILGTIELHPISYYIEKHLQNLIKKLNYPPEKKTEIKEILSLAIQEEDGFKKLLGEHIKTDTDTFLTSYLEQNKSCLGKLLESLNDEKSEKTFLINLIERTPELKEKYLKYFTDNYLVEEKTAIENSIAELKKEETNASEKLANISAEIQARNTTIASLNTRCNELKELDTALKTQLNNTAHEFLNNLNSIKEILGLCGNPTTEIEIETPRRNRQNIFRRPKIQVESTDEIISLERLDDMVEALADNLKEFFDYNEICKDSCLDINERYNYARLISGSYLYNIPLLCFGYSAEKLAQIISQTFCAETADILCIPSGFNDYGSLLAAINESNSKYIILENLVGYAEEYCYLHLSTDIPHKHIIFVTEFSETIKLLPGDMYSSMICLDCNKQTNRSFYIFGGKVDDNILNDLDNTSEMHAEIQKIVSKLIRQTPITPGYISLRLPILDTFVGNNKELVKMLFPELKTILVTLGYSDEYREMLRKEKEKIFLDFLKILPD